MDCLLDAGWAKDVQRSQKMTLRRGTAVNASGKARIEQILKAAFQILLRDGYASVTLREIARRCKVRVGAISYYYKSRKDLLKDLLEWAATPYFDIYDQLVSDTSLSAEQRFERLIRLILEDIQTEQTTRLFPELWAMANHDPFVAKIVNELYIRQRSSYARLIAEINPALGDEEREVLALFVSASIEGTTMFIGHKKPYVGALLSIESIAVSSMVHLVRTTTNDHIRREMPALHKQEQPGAHKDADRTSNGSGRRKHRREARVA
jgi:AcrR family transcriptional regulator